MGKLRAQLEGLSVPATIVTANLAKDTLVRITADKTVDAQNADAFVVGRVLKPSKDANGSGTIETRFKELMEMKADGAIAAGDPVKASTESPAGTQRVKKWIGQTDTVAGDKPESLLGICWKGGADAATVEILVR